VSTILLPESFPALPNAVRKMQEMFANSQIDNKKLIDLLEDDPLLCANILKIVNSPHYGLIKKISSISHAVMLLGSTIIRGIVMAAMLKKSFPLNLLPYNISIEEFDNICALRVKFLNSLPKDVELDMQTLSSAAFLMEAGKIITSNLILQNNYNHQFSELLQSLSINEAEKLIFGMDSYQVAGVLFHKWAFDDGFTQLISKLSTPQSKGQKLLHVISTLISVKGILSDETINDALSLATLYELDANSIKKSIEIIKKELV
jgi:HD-like signal output (HDOD) protein